MGASMTHIQPYRYIILPCWVCRGKVPEVQLAGVGRVRDRKQAGIGFANVKSNVRQALAVNLELCGHGHRQHQLLVTVFSIDKHVLAVSAVSCTIGRRGAVGSAVRFSSGPPSPPELAMSLGKPNLGRAFVYCRLLGVASTAEATVATPSRTERRCILQGRQRHHTWEERGMTERPCRGR